MESADGEAKLGHTFDGGNAVWPTRKKGKWKDGCSNGHAVRGVLVAVAGVSAGHRHRQPLPEA
ncbi:hypothetical protein HPP92_017339 [Vanilla planifolia]|uniref:Uncharacterized protein n=1 Tax=Vanilla planifolia TaxID=51239 RepID=A0A835UQH3_VANPL|nr:hypothetical protein HPP92_017339 [Vanilla planifolia]